MKTRGIVLEPELSVDVEPSPTILYDLSRYQNNGTITAGAGGYIRLPSGLWVYEFDGSASVITIADSPSLRYLTLGDFTIESWVYVTGNQAAYSPMFDKADRPALCFSSTNSSFQLAVYTGSYVYVTDPAPLSDYFGHWAHVVGTQSTTFLSLFVNGVLVVGPSHKVGARATSTNPARIGYTGSVGRYVDGQIGGQCVYSYALTAGQILQHFEATRRLFGV